MLYAWVGAQKRPPVVKGELTIHGRLQMQWAAN